MVSWTTRIHPSPHSPSQLLVQDDAQGIWPRFSPLKKSSPTPITRELLTSKFSALASSVICDPEKSQRHNLCCDICHSSERGTEVSWEQALLPADYPDQNKRPTWVHAQSCLTFCDPMEWSPPGSSIHGILQARILEWVATPPPRDLPGPGIKPESPALQADSLLLSHWGNSNGGQTSC